MHWILLQRPAAQHGAVQLWSVIVNICLLNSCWATGLNGIVGQEHQLVLGTQTKRTPFLILNFVLSSSLIYFFCVSNIESQETRNCSSKCPLHRDTWAFCLAAFLTYLWSTVILMSNKIITNTCNAPHRPPKPQCQLQLSTTVLEVLVFLLVA